MLSKKKKVFTGHRLFNKYLNKNRPGKNCFGGKMVPEKIVRDPKIQGKCPETRIVPKKKYFLGKIVPVSIVGLALSLFSCLE